MSSEIHVFVNPAYLSTCPTVQLLQVYSRLASSPQFIFHHCQYFPSMKAYQLGHKHVQHGIHGEFPFLLYKAHVVEKHKISKFLAQLFGMEEGLTDGQKVKFRTLVQALEMNLGPMLVTQDKGSGCVAGSWDPITLVQSLYQAYFEQQYLDLNSQVKNLERLRPTLNLLKSFLASQDGGSDQYQTFYDGVQTGQETGQVSHLDLVLYSYVRSMVNGKDQSVYKWIEN